MVTLRSVLVATDFSVYSADALRQAVRVAASTNAQVTLLQVVHPPVLAVEQSFTPFPVPLPTDADWRTAATARLRVLSGGVRARYLDDPLCDTRVPPAARSFDWYASTSLTCW